MTVHVTYFDAITHSDASGFGRASNARGVFSSQLGNAEVLLSGQNGSIDAAQGRYALIKVLDDHRIDIVAGSAIVGAAGGLWFAGEVDTRYVAAGHRVSVGAPA